MKWVIWVLCMVLSTELPAGEMFAAGRSSATQIGNQTRDLGRIGRRRGGRRRGGSKGGRRRGGRSGSDSRNYRRPTKIPFQKWALPPEEKVPSLDNALIESVLNTIGTITKEQKIQIAATKSRIKERGEALRQEQARSRGVYQQAKGEETCRAAAQQVTNASAAIRGFSPKNDFASAMQRILNREQYVKFRKLCMI